MGDGVGEIGQRPIVDVQPDRGLTADDEAADPVIGVSVVSVVGRAEPADDRSRDGVGAHGVFHYRCDARERSWSYWRLDPDDACRRFGRARRRTQGEHIDARQAREEAELLRLEEELAALEREEEERKEAEREAAAVMDVSSDDLWQVGSAEEAEPAEEAGVLRFAEDIAGFRDQGDGRRRRGGGGGARRRGGRR